MQIGAYVLGLAMITSLFIRTGQEPDHRGRAGSDVGVGWDRLSLALLGHDQPRGGRLAGWNPGEMAGEVLSALVERTGIDPKATEGVIMGCVGQVGEQSLHIGRNAVLVSRLPDSIPAVSIDRQCGSSQQAIQFAAQVVCLKQLDQA